MTLHNRIKEIIAESPYKPAEIARRIDVSRATVSLWMNNGTKSVASDNLINLCDLLGVNFKWLQTGKGDKYVVSKSNVDYVSNMEFRVPLVSWVRAGEFCETQDLFSPGDAEEWIPKPPNASNSSYALRVKGGSMTSPYPNAKSYPEGTIIIIDPEKDVLPGDRGIFRSPDDNEATFKELVSDAGKLYLKPLNPQFPMIEVDKEIITCGKVIASYIPE